jgi:PhoH-like ATPase
MFLSRLTGAIMKKTFALDTNVLIHDPNAILNFEEHEVVLSMVVLEELDKLKVGNNSLSQDCRQAVRAIDKILGESTPAEIMKGVPIPRAGENETLGTLIILMPTLNEKVLMQGLPDHINDNKIINDLLSYQQTNKDRQIALVTKDINMRLKAKGCGLEAQDYHNDQLVSDIDRLTTGYTHVEGAFWELAESIEPQILDGSGMHSLSADVLEKITGVQMFENQFILDDKHFIGRIIEAGEDYYQLEITNTEAIMRQKAWGLSPRDVYQGLSMKLLLDPNVDLVALNGSAGSGKTILALACALEQAVEHKEFKRIIATRSTRGLDEDIGFLPGSESEKMAPWLGAFTDNLEALHSEDYDPESSEEYVDGNLPLHFKSLNFVRGRSFQYSILIVDEAQNLTPHQIKTIVTRAGEGTKVICLGNLAQIDTPYLGATSSGLTYMSERFKGFAYGGSITLKGVARSRLAAYAEQHL